MSDDAGRTQERRRALISVAPFDELADLSRGLLGAGWEIVATGDARAMLDRHGLAAMDVADFVGVTEDFPFPPTLHPRMERALSEDGPDRIDLVFDLPYPLEKGMDVGGHTLLALAVKGGRLPVTTIPDMEMVVKHLAGAAALPEALHRQLTEKALSAISRFYVSLLSRAGDGGHEAAILEAVGSLEHGENPYQRPAALYRDGSDDPLGLDRFEQLCGNLPCFTNMADFDSVLETLVRLHRGCLACLDEAEAPFIAVAAKHGNPCGMGASMDDRLAAVDKALWGNPRAVWGGEMMINFAIDDEVAATLHRSERRREALGSAEWMLHMIGAPAAAAQAVDRLSGNPHRKVLVNPALEAPSLCSARAVRPVRGGALIQPPPSYVLDFAAVEWPNGGPPTDQGLDLLIAWATAYTASCGGNEVALARDAQLLGLGGGPSTVDAVESAIDRARGAGHALDGAAFVADAFFPFTDGPEALCAAGVGAGLVPGGGQGYDDVIAFFGAKNVPIGIIPEQYRGFCRH